MLGKVVRNREPDLYDRSSTSNMLYLRFLLVFYSGMSTRIWPVNPTSQTFWPVRIFDPFCNDMIIFNTLSNELHRPDQLRSVRNWHDQIFILVYTKAFKIFDKIDYETDQSRLITSKTWFRSSLTDYMYSLIRLDQIHCLIN